MENFDFVVENVRYHIYDENKVVFGKSFQRAVGGCETAGAEDELPLGAAVQKRWRVVPHG